MCGAGYFGGFAEATPIVGNTFIVKMQEFRWVQCGRFDRIVENAPRVPPVWNATCKELPLKIKRISGDGTAHGHRDFIEVVPRVTPSMECRL